MSDELMLSRNMSKDSHSRLLVPRRRPSRRLFIETSSLPVRHRLLAMGLSRSHGSRRLGAQASSGKYAAGCMMLNRLDMLMIYRYTGNRKAKDLFDTNFCGVHTTRRGTELPSQIPR